MNTGLWKQGMPYRSAADCMMSSAWPDMLTERGIDVSYETVRRWALKFGTIIPRK
jgi:hypothetical protein